MRKTGSKMKSELAQEFRSSSFEWNWYSLCAVLILECIRHALWQLTDYESRPLRLRHTRVRSSPAQLTSVTLWLFPIHLRDVPQNINSSKHGRDEWGRGSTTKRTLIQFLSFSANCSTARFVQRCSLKCEHNNGIRSRTVQLHALFSSSSIRCVCLTNLTTSTSASVYSV